jgi:hypothetical protein
MRRTSLLPLTIVLVGCPKAPEVDATAADNPRQQITETVTDDGLVRVAVDLNRDGRAEVWNLQRPRADAAPALVRKETDLNRDGNVDVRSYFDENGRLTKEEMDGDFDGTFDWVDHYQDGRRVMSEWDTDYDGVANVWSYFESDKITHQERDENGDGNIDYWVRFDESGNVIRTARDLDGDGQMDVRDE